jgi:hypothetical protein
MLVMFLCNPNLFHYLVDRLKRTAQKVPEPPDEPLHAGDVALQPESVPLPV